MCAAVFWGPLGIWLMLSGRAIAPEASAAAAFIYVAGSSLLHLGYFSTLLKGYQCGDLSLVYPLARGTGPFLSTILAIILYGERPSVPAFLGALLIAGGAFFLAGNGESCDDEGHGAMQGSTQAPGAQAMASAPELKVKGRATTGQSAAIFYGLLTGVFIAAYTLWDKRALSVGGVNPLFLEWGTCLGRFVMLGPWFLLTPAGRASLAQAWRDQRRPAVIVALLSPASYMMVLSALAVSPVTYIAPAREISILLGTLAGSRLLMEGDQRLRTRRLIAATAMALGVAALAIW
jgi:uncharacterized membrane protein